MFAFLTWPNGLVFVGHEVFHGYADHAPILREFISALLHTHFVDLDEHTEQFRIMKTDNILDRANNNYNLFYT